MRTVSTVSKRSGPQQYRDDAQHPLNDPRSAACYSQGPRPLLPPISSTPVSCRRRRPSSSAATSSPPGGLMCRVPWSRALWTRARPVAIDWQWSNPNLKTICRVHLSMELHDFSTFDLSQAKFATQVWQLHCHFSQFAFFALCERSVLVSKLLISN